ncbi:guanylate cyclase domain-containing protein [Haematococcus lacustris]|uniref:Guanylate cyclase domain-containing protein n=1 Tax=Haematococcus lacustris TaxID=44745 RepID=A0A699YDV7_HAELA|nr:guanylate cyclase domain-containing protein [Haematococcus lacustris]
MSAWSASLRDFTERARLEKTLTELTEAQLSMLSQIFPRHVIEALSMGADIDVDTIARLARSHTGVSILFMDIAGFTAMSKDVPAEEVIIFLNILFSHFDMLVESHGVQKVDTVSKGKAGSMGEPLTPLKHPVLRAWQPAYLPCTVLHAPTPNTSHAAWHYDRHTLAIGKSHARMIGDAYLVASGILVHDAQGFRSVNEQPDPEVNAQRLVAFAFDMMRAALPVRMPNGQLVRLRIGIHTGPCVSGLVGMGVPKWSVFGDTVNTAARLEQTCELQKIQISEYTHSLLGGCFAGFTPTGGVHMKGKGVVQTYLWAPPDDWILAAETGQTLSPLSITPQSSLPSPAPPRPASPASATPAFTAGYAGKPTLVLPATILEAPDSCHVNSIILAESTSSSHAFSCLAHGDSPSTSLAPVALSADLQAVPPYALPNLLSSLSSIDPSSDGNLLRPSQVEGSYSSCHAPLQPLLDITAASHLPQPPLCSGRSFILGPDNQPSSTASTVSGAMPHLGAAEQTPLVSPRARHHLQCLGRRCHDCTAYLPTTACQAVAGWQPGPRQHQACSPGWATL